MAAVAPSISTATLDLTSLPPIYILKSQVTSRDIRDAEDTLVSNNAILTYDIREAGVVLTGVSTARRVRLELKWSGILLAGNCPPKYRRQVRKRIKLEREHSSSSHKTEHYDNNAASNEQSVHSSESSDGEVRPSPRHVSTHFSDFELISHTVGAFSLSPRSPRSCQTCLAFRVNCIRCFITPFAFCCTM